MHPTTVGDNNIKSFAFCERYNIPKKYVSEQVGIIIFYKTCNSTLQQKKCRTFFVYLFISDEMSCDFGCFH